MNDYWPVIQEKQSHLMGTASVLPDGSIKVYYGADDGADDKVLSRQDFVKQFDVLRDFQNCEDYDAFCGRYGW
ncbi:MAG: hypothetical protein IJQ24_02710 [Synergistaceae bacterium]|nr:hypothetical protein [Synergistaceae bacterium]